MANIAIFRINYKSDFILTLNSDAGWLTPFCIKFWTGAPSQAYFVGFDGETYTHCAPVEGEPTKLLVQFDDHHLPIGELKFQIGYHFTVADFPTSVEDEVLNQAAVIIDNEGTPEQVMLDFTGETAPEIEFSLPAYANEAQRIANEEQRIENEQQRIAQETARVNEFATLKSQSQAATSAANTAASLANEKAQLAADKAALADAAANLATQKAQLAADKAALAQQKADYAQAQGDYAKAQGDTALADHERAVEDHTQAGQDHTTAANDHITAGNDHTRAESDHTRAESDHAAVEVYVDSLGAFDISAYHATGGELAKYADLTAALGANGANIPEAIRKGGMSVKFVLSSVLGSDNKYIQARCMAQNFTTDVTQWQKQGAEVTVSQDTSTGEVEMLIGDSKQPSIAGAKSLNLFNPNDADVETGKFISNSNGTLSAHANYNTSGFISVVEGVTYYNSIESARKFGYVLFYNAAKEPITSSYINADTSSITAPANAAFVRISFYAATESYSFSQVAEIYAHYEPYNIIGKYTANFDNEIKNAVDTLNYKNGCPLKDAYIDNSYYRFDNGLVYSANTYCRSKLIKTSEPFYLIGLKYAGIMCYNANGLYLGEVTAEPTRMYVDLLENTQYVGLNFIKANQEENYLENGYIIFNSLLKKIIPSNILYGKKWVVVGDSFSAWSNEQYADGRYKTYKWFIQERNNMKIVDMTASGRTMAYPNDHTFDNAFAKPTLYQSIPTDADYITIMLGINDESHLAQYSPDGESTAGYITLGTIDSVDTGSFYGAWNVVMQWIFEHCPNAHVGIIITNGLGKQGPDGLYDEIGEEIYQALKDIVQRWNVPFIDLNGGDGKTPMMQRGIYPTGTPAALIAAKWNAFATSPTSPMNGHTNVAGHLYSSTFIENFLRSL